VTARKFDPDRFQLDDWDDDHGHHGFSITSPTDSDTCAEFLPGAPAEAVYGLRVKHAQVLAAVFALMSPQLEDLRQQHRCGPLKNFDDTCCGAWLNPAGLDPGADLGDAPALDVAVPAGEYRTWKRRTLELVHATAAVSASAHAPRLPVYVPAERRRYEEWDRQQRENEPPPPPPQPQLLQPVPETTTRPRRTA